MPAAICLTSIVHHGCSVPWSIVSPQPFWLVFSGDAFIGEHPHVRGMTQFQSKVNIVVAVFVVA